jgi:hypothetical protein
MRTLILAAGRHSGRRRAEVPDARDACAILCRVLRLSHSIPALISLTLAASICAPPPALAGSKPPAIEVFVPDRDAEGAPELRGATWLQYGKEFVIRLQQISDAERQAYIEKATGIPTDPFAGRPGVRPRFVAFVLEIENLGEGSLHMNPAHCWLSTNRSKIETPMGLTDLSFAYRVAGQDLPPAYEKVGPLLLDRPVVVPPKESVHGLLVYHNVEPKTRSYKVDVQLTMPDGDVVRFSAPYRRAKRGAVEEP